MDTIQPSIMILNKEVPITHESKSIFELKFLVDNPRVYSSFNGAEIPDDNNEKQELIESLLLQEPSVKNLIPDIKRHGGLTDPIFIRYDTKEVIEGNSRLAAYRYLYKNEGPDKWSHITCQIVDKLSIEEQYAYLNQEHVKGKTPWSAYEKANLAYVIKHKDKRTEVEIAEILTESVAEIKKRIKVIEMMHSNEDKKLDRFSYYDVLVRNRKISSELSTNIQLEKVLLDTIKAQGEPNPGVNAFSALELRDRLPDVINKKKCLKKFISNDISFDEAYQRSRLSGPVEKLKKVLERLKSVDADEIMSLENQDISKMEYSINKIQKELDRIRDIVQKANK